MTRSTLGPLKMFVMNSKYFIVYITILSNSEGYKKFGVSLKFHN
jgi:hypothetical protein